MPLLTELITPKFSRKPESWFATLDRFQNYFTLPEGYCSSQRTWMLLNANPMPSGMDFGGHCNFLDFMVLEKIYEPSWNTPIILYIEWESWNTPIILYIEWELPCTGLPPLLTSQYSIWALSSSLRSKQMCFCCRWLFDISQFWRRRCLHCNIVWKNRVLVGGVSSSGEKQHKKTKKKMKNLIDWYLQCNVTSKVRINVGEQTLRLKLRCG